jgi:hypothetical protein
MRKFRRGDIPAVVVALLLSSFWLYMYFEHRDWRPPSGFGPEWKCTESGARGGGPDFCIKMPPENAASQTTTPN